MGGVAGYEDFIDLATVAGLEGREKFRKMPIW